MYRAIIRWPLEKLALCRRMRSESWLFISFLPFSPLAQPLLAGH